MAFVRCVEAESNRERILTLVYDEFDGIKLKSFLTAKDGRIYQVGMYQLKGEELFIIRNEKFMQGRWDCIKAFEQGKEAPNETPYHDTD